MDWKKFSVGKIVASIVGLIIGLIMKFPKTIESLPPKYEILGITFTQSQYLFINIISIVVLLISSIYIIILLIDKFNK